MNNKSKIQKEILWSKANKKVWQMAEEDDVKKTCSCKDLNKYCWKGYKMSGQNDSVLLPLFNCLFSFVVWLRLRVYPACWQIEVVKYLISNENFQFAIEKTNEKFFFHRQRRIEENISRNCYYGYVLNGLHTSIFNWLNFRRASFNKNITAWRHGLEQREAKKVSETEIHLRLSISCKQKGSP